MVEGLDLGGGQPRAVGGEDGTGQVAEARPEVLAGLEPDHGAARHVDAVEQEDLGVQGLERLGRDDHIDAIATQPGGRAEVDEHAPPGEGYLADVARVWEAATGPAESAGVRVVRLRTGFPLYRDGGLLGPMVLPFRLGLGGRIGSGRQWQPWISMADWLDAAVFLLTREDLAGPVNMVGPAPVRSVELTRALARELGRPAVLPIPGPLLRVLMSEFGTDVLASKRVVPGVLHRAGFSFTHADVRSALRAALATPVTSPQ